MKYIFKFLLLGFLFVVYVRFTLMFATMFDTSPRYYLLIEIGMTLVLVFSAKLLFLKEWKQNAR